MAGRTRVNCPFLGSLIDRTTNYVFPSIEAICFSSEYRYRPSLRYQEQLCLRRLYIRCPRFTAAEARASDESKGVMSGPRKGILAISRGRLATATVVLAIVLPAITYLLMQTGEGWGQSPASRIPLTSNLSPVTARGPDRAQELTETVSIQTAVPPPAPTEMILSSISVPTATVTPNQTSVNVYFIVYEAMPGDTLASVAKFFNISTSQLASVNGLSERQALVAGMRLVIPRNLTVVTPEVAPAPTAVYLIALVHNTSWTGLKLRAQPGTQAMVLTVIPEMSQVEVLDKTLLSGVLWYRVRFEGQTGWCHGEYLQLPE